MAATAIVNTVLGFNTAAALPATAAVDAADGALITCDKADQKMLIIMENADGANAENVTIVKGNGVQGVADLVVALAASEKKVITIESGKYKNLSGTNKGKIKVTGTADVKLACVVLP